MKILLIAIFLIIFTLGLSYLFHVPYFYTILGFSAWSFVGHLITLDDDFEGAWSNQENSKTIWKESKKELLYKFLIAALLALTFLLYPAIKEFGA